MILCPLCSLLWCPVVQETTRSLLERHISYGQQPNYPRLRINRNFTNRLGRSEFVIGFPCLPSVLIILSVTLALDSTLFSSPSTSPVFSSRTSLLDLFSRLLKNSAFRFLSRSSFSFCCLLSFSRPLFDCCR